MLKPLVGNSQTSRLSQQSWAKMQTTEYKQRPMFATKFFPEEAIPAIERMCESHEGIIAIESIMEAMKDGSFAGNAESSAGTTEQQLREMMNDPRYWKDRDPSYIKQVTDGFQQIYR